MAHFRWNKSSRKNSHVLGLVISLLVLFMLGLILLLTFHSGYSFRTVTNKDEFVLHYIRFQNNSSGASFPFISYLSVISGVKRLRPHRIIVHGNVEPHGTGNFWTEIIPPWLSRLNGQFECSEMPAVVDVFVVFDSHEISLSRQLVNSTQKSNNCPYVTGSYWNELKSKNLIEFRYREKTDIAGHRFGKAKKVGWVEHSADMVKLDVLVEYGGVVADFDVFFVRGERIKEILKSKESITCYGDEDGYNIGFVAARKGAKLIRAWRLSYDVIYVKDWNFNQSPVARYLSILYSDVNYVVNNVCNNPHPDSDLSKYFNEYNKLNWTDSLAIHSYERFGGIPIISPKDLEGSLTTHKELLRSIYEDSPLPPIGHSYRDEIDPLTDRLL